MNLDNTCHRPHEALNILVADDNEINRALIQRILEKAGYRVDMVDNGRQAVEFSNQTQYDLILMDIQMPLMDGYEATKIIRNAEEDRGQRSEVRGLNTEDRRQRPEDGGQRAEGQDKIGENSDLKSPIRNPKSEIPTSPIPGFQSQIRNPKSEIPNPQSPIPNPQSRRFPSLP